ncbi:acyl-CoA dehydrogenase family protein [Thermodesulfobacteriota bacterium]
MGTFKGVDFAGIDDLLSEEERMTRDTVRDLVESEFLPIIADHFEAGTFPLEFLGKLGGMGLLGMKIDGYGCTSASNVQYGLVCQELERGDSGLRSFMSVQTSLVMYPIYTFGSAEQRERWLPPMARGEAVGCFGLTEPDHGSDPGSMKTRARKDGGDWVINGSKMWITNGSIADFALVWAMTDDGIMGFIVEKGTPGFEARKISHKMSLRASITSELVLDDVRVPEAARLPDAAGLKVPLMCLNEARYGISWGAMGAAMACYDAALEYAKERTQFGRPIASFQLTQQKLVRMITEITKAQLLGLQVGRLKDAGNGRHYHTSMAKMNNVQEALKIAREARSILGANGISLEYPVIRHMNNLESVLTYEGTHEVHTLIIGRQITGLDAFGA